MTMLPIPAGPMGWSSILQQVVGGAKPPVGTPPFGLPAPGTGGAEPPTTPESLPQKRGLAGIMDRLSNPNAMGRLGLALMASRDNEMGRVAKTLAGFSAGEMKAKEAKQRKFQDLGGGRFGWVDPETGQVQVTYEPPAKPAAPHYWESNDGSLMAVGEDGRPQTVYKDPSPKMNFIPDGLGGGQWVAVPTVPGGLVPPQSSMPQSLGTTLPPGWTMEGGAGGNASGGFRAR